VEDMSLGFAMLHRSFSFGEGVGGSGQLTEITQPATKKSIPCRLKKSKDRT